MDNGQRQTLGLVMKYMEERGFDGKHTLQELVDQLYARLEKDGFAALLEKRGQSNDLPGNLAMPRREEILACLNRYRKLI